MRTLKLATLSIATAGLLVGSLAACSTTSTAAGPTPLPITTAGPAPVASLPTLAGVDTKVTLDAGFIAALGSLKLTPGVVGSATLSDAGVLSFPITGGNVKYFDPTQKYRPYVQGSIDHAGSGISLSSGDTTVELTDFRIDPGSSQLFGTVTANGTKVGDDLYIFTLDGSTLKPLAKDADGNAVLEGTTVRISPDAAALLNDAFKTTAVTDQLVVGIAKITVKPAA